MGTSINTIKNRVRASDETKAAFNTAGRNATKFGRAASKAGEIARRAMRAAGLAIAAGAAAATAAAAGALRLTTANAALEDSTGKLATRLSVSVEELSRYQHMAQLSGNTNGDLETAFQKLQKSVGDAHKGLAAQRDALEALNLTSEELIKLPVNQQFDKIAAAMQGIEEPARRTQIAMDLMGRGGAKMLQSINLGTEAMADMRAEADLLGITITGESAASAAAFNDDMLRLQGTLKGLSRLFTEELKPIFTVLFQEARVAMLDNKDAAVDFAEAIQGRVIQGLRIALAVMRFFHNAWLGIKLVGSAALAGISTGIELAIQGLRAIMLPLDLIFDGLVKLGTIEANPFDGLQNSMTDFTAAAVDQTKDVLTEIEAVNRAYDATGATIDTLNQKINEQRQANKEAGLALTDPGAAITGGDPLADPRIAAEEAIQAKLIETQEIAAQRKLEIAQRERQGVVQSTLQGLKAIGAGSRKAFNLYKQLAIAQTLMDTYKAAQGAYSAMAGIPYIGPFLGVAAAAVAIGAGLARVRQIRSMTPGSSGAGGATSGGGTPPSPSSVSAPAAPTGAPASAPAAGGGGQVINVVIKGDSVDHDGFMRKLAESSKKLANRDNVDFGFTTTGAATGA